ncbi:hypothetical protein LHK_00126 [Laribacter hongkongensis HLHK9]|uniref:Uncharacterized protein n=1 Tax=Laribacter hongkongensis (strain HLHK9) TaxID=557598 RepID=C1DA09_LARHH|nr:hypothetical protein LHK_00126 [Laribacter hongkongensis HLHK9]
MSAIPPAAFACRRNLCRNRSAVRSSSIADSVNHVYEAIVLALPDRHNTHWSSLTRKHHKVTRKHRFLVNLASFAPELPAHFSPKPVCHRMDSCHAGWMDVA